MGRRERVCGQRALRRGGLADRLPQLRFQTVVLPWAPFPEWRRRSSAPSRPYRRHARAERPPPPAALVVADHATGFAGLAVAVAAARRRRRGRLRHLRHLRLLGGNGSRPSLGHAEGLRIRPLRLVAACECTPREVLAVLTAVRQWRCVAAAAIAAAIAAATAAVARAGMEDIGREVRLEPRRRREPFAPPRAGGAPPPARRRPCDAAAKGGPCARRCVEEPGRLSNWRRGHGAARGEEGRWQARDGAAARRSCGRTLCAPSPTAAARRLSRSGSRAECKTRGSVAVSTAAVPQREVAR